MNENINLCEILKDCPKGTRLYSPALGFCLFEGISYIYEEPEIEVRVEKDNATWCASSVSNVFNFSKEGYLFIRGERECLLFPSKEQRDWSKWKCPKPKKPKFDPKTLQPFDKVLGRDAFSDKWRCAFMSHFDDEIKHYKYISTNGAFKWCIPYNEETKHLVGTSDEAPEFYRHWED